MCRICRICRRVSPTNNACDASSYGLRIFPKDSKYKKVSLNSLLTFRVEFNKNREHVFFWDRNGCVKVQPYGYLCLCGLSDRYHCSHSQIYIANPLGGNMLIYMLNRENPMLIVKMCMFIILRS